MDTISNAASSHTAALDLCKAPFTPATCLSWTVTILAVFGDSVERISFPLTVFQFELSTINCNKWADDCRMLQKSSVGWRCCWCRVDATWTIAGHVYTAAGRRHTDNNHRCHYFYISTIGISQYPSMHCSRTLSASQPACLRDQLMHGTRPISDYRNNGCSVSQCMRLGCQEVCVSLVEIL